MTVAPVTPVHYLADHGGSFTKENVPARIRRAAVLRILDTVGCIIAGTVGDEPKAVIRMQQALENASGSAGGNCTVIGSSVRLSMTAAARCNAYAGDLFELNDLLGGHASIGNVDAMLSVAEGENSTGEELVLAVVAGLEATTKLFNSYHFNEVTYDKCLMVSVGLPSSTGAAIGCGRLLGLKGESLRHAAAIGAATCTVCPGEVIFQEGGTMKPLLFGALPAETAIQAAYLAQAGLTGPPRILDGTMGFYSSAATKVNYNNLYSKTWELDAVTTKLHAGCGHIHASLDCLVTLRERSPIWPPIKIDVVVPPKVYSTTGLKTKIPTSGNEARFHGPYLCAVAAASPTPVQYILPSHSEDFATQLQHPIVDKLLKTATCTEGYDFETFYHSATVTVTFEDGSTLTESVTAPRGSAKNQATEEMLIAKFDALAEPVAGKERANKIKDAILGLEEATSLKPLFELLQGPW